MAKPTSLPTKKQPKTAPVQQRQAVVNGASLHTTATFSGPMPPPSVLEGYENLLPGAAERILAMAEADTKHQHAIEMAALKAAEGEVKRGQYFGFLMGITALAASIVALTLGSPAVAGVIGGTTVVGLVSVFIIGRFTKAE